MAYDFHKVKTPRLYGPLLRGIVRLIENRSTGPLFLSKMLRDAGVDRFRGHEVTAAPTLYPSHPPGAKVSRKQARRSIEFDEDSEFPVAPGFKALTSADYARAYRHDDVSPVDVARRLVAAIQQSEWGKKPLRAVIDYDEVDLLDQAHASELRFRAGKPLSLLDGVPILVKDEMDVAGYLTRVGTKVLGHETAKQDATAVARLRAAGALIAGKTNMHEIGIGVTGLNPHYGVARNPVNPDFHTGGSSSGSAAAVAAGLCPIAVGADGGGSIRIPSALCGVFGIKATFGRIPGLGAAPLDWSVAHIGPLAASATDLALAYSIMAGPEAGNGVGEQQPPVNLIDFEKEDLSGLRLGIYEPWFRHASEAVVSACDTLVAHLKSRGAEVRHIEIPDLEVLRIAHTITIASEMAVNMAEEYERDQTRFGLDTRLSLALARSLGSADYIQAQRVRSEAMQAFESAFRDCDVIVTPTTGCTAPKIRQLALAGGESDLATMTDLMRFATPGNFVGLPAISVPAGYDESGLPIGCQLMGRPWAENLLFRVARVAEQHVDRKKPQVSFSLL